MNMVSLTRNIFNRREIPMNTKNAIVAIISTGCVIILITSYLIYQARIDTVGENATAREQTELIKKESPDDQEISEETNKNDTLNIDKLTGLTGNLDIATQEMILSRFEQKETVQFLIVGSEAMNDGSPGYAERLQKNMKSAYGDFFEVDVSSFDGSVTEFLDQIENGTIDWQNGYDIVLFEPFTVNNNGVVIVEDAFENVLSIQDFIQSKVSDAQLVIHPSYPIYNSVYYPVEVNALKEYSLANGLAYIDHWTEWPNINDEQLLSYFNEDRMTLNSEGANLWANTLSTYFIGN